MNKKMLKNSKAGRIICRLLGEETGATMMEYVILAVMIAAAVTAAAIYFGNTAKNQFDVAGAAMTGKTGEAEAKSKGSQQLQETEAGHAHTSAKEFGKPTETQGRGTK